MVTLAALCAHVAAVSGLPAPRGIFAIGVRADVPVDPDAPHATQLLIQELAKPIYRAAQPTAFDRFAKAIQDWFASLKFGTAQASPTWAIAVVVALVVAAIIVAIVIFGVPRLNRRSARSAVVLAASDDRAAAQVRASARVAANRGDFSTAVIEMFRAIALGLLERSIVHSTPGTTALTFSALAGKALPEFAPRLESAARVFDSVRYLNREGTATQFDELSMLERELSARHVTPELTLA